MFKASKASTVSEYKKQVPENRKDLFMKLDSAIKEAAPDLKPYFASNMLGYGKFKYTNYKKEVIDWPIIALANQKSYISVYVCAVVDGEYLAEKHQEELGKVSVGRSCIRIKKEEDINIPALKKLIKQAAKHPGLV